MQTSSFMRFLAAVIVAISWQNMLRAQDAPVKAAFPAVAVAEVAPVANATSATATATTVVYSFRQLGVDYQMEMVGPETTLGVPFGIRVDQVPSEARLILKYQVAERLPEGKRAELSIRLNGIPAGTLAVASSDAGHSGQLQVNLPAVGLTDLNQIELDLKVSGSSQCREGEVPIKWLQIANDSRIEVVTQPLAIANDLAQWPLPYFDPGDIHPIQLTMLFAGHPNRDELRMAGILASWLGSKAEFRGTDFSVSEGIVPAGANVIALLTPEHPLAGMAMPMISGPQVEMRNLDDAGHKLLLVMGRNDTELQTAILGLVEGEVMNGATHHFGAAVVPAPRQPYDAPAWVGVHGPSTLTKLNPHSQFSVQGPFPDSIGGELSLPPDLFSLQPAKVPLNLHYRASASPPNGGWSMDVNINDLPVAQWKLAESADPTSMFAHWRAVADDDQQITAHRTLEIPLDRFSTHSQLRFQFHFVRQWGCVTAVSRQAKATIDPTSTIDISHFRHFIAMPDLAAFVNSGFPFSRLADLSQTAIVLPQIVSPAVEQQLLNVFGLIGARTGYPAYRASLTDASHVDAFAHDDLLLLGSPPTMPLFKRWADQLPTQSEPKGMMERIRSWATLNIPEPILHSRRPDLPSTVESVFDFQQFDVVLMGFRSPLAHDRSVVAIEAMDPIAANQLFAVLRDPRGLKRVQGSVATVGAGHIQSYLGLQTYYVGQLDPLSKWLWKLSNAPWMVALLVLLVTALSAVLGARALRKRAAYRLNEEYKDG